MLYSSCHAKLGLSKERSPIHASVCSIADYQLAFTQVTATSYIVAANSLNFTVNTDRYDDTRAFIPRMPAGSGGGKAALPTESSPVENIRPDDTRIYIQDPPVGVSGNDKESLPSMVTPVPVPVRPDTTRVFIQASPISGESDTPADTPEGDNSKKPTQRSPRPQEEAAKAGQQHAMPAPPPPMRETPSPPPPLDSALAPPPPMEPPRPSPPPPDKPAKESPAPEPIAPSENNSLTLGWPLPNPKLRDQLSVCPDAHRIWQRQCKGKSEACPSE